MLRTDIFSFGVVLYEMATGIVPFRKDSWVETMHAIIEQPHIPARQLNQNVPAELEGIIDGALQKSPDERYAAVDAIAADLERVPKGMTLNRRAQTGEGRTARLRRWAWTVVAPVLFIVFYSSGR